ncbi:hypothetical protein [uncultured Thiodictyon sp.]|uniref:hypothetical protein n=1 Tax=uncultured Thiodictyon sp. TaxID=1846217 RepID=UPI0025F4ED30|nr:hypothetical protein [uncultured Thiodictyon sp.]
MAGITYQLAEAQLAKWIAFEDAIMLGQSVSNEGRSLTRADLGAVASRIAYWDKTAKRLAPPEAEIAPRRSQIHSAVVVG